MELCIIEQRMLNNLLHATQKSLCWLGIVLIASLCGEAIDGQLSFSDLVFISHFVLPGLIIGLLYILMAVISNNFGQDARLVWSGSQLRFDQHGETQLFLLPQIKMAKIGGRFPATLTLYLNDTDSPRKLALDGLPYKQCLQLVAAINAQTGSHTGTAGTAARSFEDVIELA